MIFSSTVVIAVLTVVGLLLWLGLWSKLRQGLRWLVRAPGRLLSAAENWVYERKKRRAELKRLEAEAARAEEARLNEQLKGEWARRRKS